MHFPSELALKMSMLSKIKNSRTTQMYERSNPSRSTNQCAIRLYCNDLVSSQDCWFRKRVRSRLTDMQHITNWAVPIPFVVSIGSKLNVPMHSSIHWLTLPLHSRQLTSSLRSAVLHHGWFFFCVGVVAPIWCDIRSFRKSIWFDQNRSSKCHSSLRLCSRSTSWWSRTASASESFFVTIMRPFDE